MSKNLPVLFIVATLLIDGMGIGLIFPVMPDLIQDLTGRPLADAAIWGGVLATSYAVMQFICAPVVGNLSDRFGRKPVLISALVVLSIDYLIMAVADTIWLLLIGRIIAGMTAATYSTAAAYMADISAPEEREKNFGLVHAAIGLGFAFGPLIGGMMATIDTRAPFYAAAVLAGANAAFGYFVMPESLKPENRRGFTIARANPFGAFSAISKLKGVGALMLVFAIYEIAFFVYPAIWAFYGRAQFGFDARTVGLTLFAFGITMAIAQAFFIGPFVARVGAFGVAAWAIAIDVAAFVVFGVSTSVVLVWMFTVVTGVCSIAGPVLQGIMSRAVPADQQGELQGVLSAIAALATIISPLLMTKTFAVFTQDEAGVYLPGAPFLVAAALTVGALFVLLKWRRGVGRVMQ